MTCVHSIDLGNAVVDTLKNSRSSVESADGEPASSLERLAPSIKRPVDPSRSVSDAAKPRSIPKQQFDVKRDDPYAGRNMFWIACILGLIGFWTVVAYLLLT